MNKSIKIWLNYILGGLISLFLLWGIYSEVKKQITDVSIDAWRHTGPDIYLLVSTVLMFVNTSLESYKWYLLTSYVEPLKYSRVLSSYITGLAFAIITPNRVGEYPARILYLGTSNTAKYINVSVLGVIAQLWSVYVFGLGALLYYNIEFPGYLPKIALIICVIANVLAGVIYWRFESWVSFFSRFNWLRKMAVYGKLLKKITVKKQLTILGISLLRFSIFTAQYLFLLRWMNVTLPFFDGYCLSALFFWIMAVIPSVSLTELGIRGQVSLYLFGHFSDNTIGMLTATVGIWVLNLVIPSIVGSILILRMRLLR